MNPSVIPRLFCPQLKHGEQLRLDFRKHNVVKTFPSLLNMHPWVLLFPLSVALLCAPAVQAIFADEAYQTDYHLPLLGLPQAHTTFFHRPSVASKASLLYTLSDRLLLGAVNPKDGAVIWRQQLGDRVLNATTSGILKAPEGGNTLVSLVDGKIQTWHATDGRLAWEWQSSEKVKGIETFAAVKEDHDVLVLSEEGSNTVVRRLAADDGSVIWEHIDARYIHSMAPYGLRRAYCL